MRAMSMWNMAPRRMRTGLSVLELRPVRFANSTLVNGIARIAAGNVRRVGILMLLALELATVGCGSNNNNNNNNTSVGGDWEAQLFGGTGQASLLHFVVSFNAIDSGPLDITGFAFFNHGACFSTNDLKSNSGSGDASFTTSNAGKVYGTLDLTVVSKTTGSTLSLAGTLTGTSNGTPTSTGALSNGVVVGKWSMNPGTSPTPH